MLNKDTIINSIKYHKLYESADSIFQESEYCGGIREDTVLKRIYYYGNRVIFFDNEEVILYDFSVMVGDTLIGNYNFPPSGDNYIVDRIDSILIENTYRKQIYFKYFGSVFYWIEGIGNIRGLLTTSGTFPNNGTWYDLVCFKQNDKWLYHNENYSECFPNFVGIDDMKTDRKNILVFPNPVTDISYLNLDKSNNQFMTLDVMNASGIKVKSYNVKGESEIEINKNDFSQGIYFYCLYSKEDYSVFGKFIIE